MQASFALCLTADEINGIEVNEKLTYAAAADDSGCLTIIDIKSRKIHKVCVRFLPFYCTGEMMLDLMGNWVGSGATCNTVCLS